MKRNLLALFICTIVMILGATSLDAQQNIVCNGIAYSFENGNIYQENEQGERTRIGYNVKSIDCFYNKRVLAHMPDGNILGYDGRPNFWSPFVKSENPCNEPVGTYLFDSEKGHMDVGDRIYMGKVLSSENGKYFALLTEDGRFTMNRVTENTMCAGGISVYLNYEEIWAAPTDNGTAGPGGYVELHETGILCLFDKDGNQKWCAPSSRGSVKVDIFENEEAQTGCLQSWGMTSVKWSSCM